MDSNVTSIRDDDARVTFTPYIGVDGRVGYHCRHDSGKETFIYLNPSTGSDDIDHVPNVFVYLGDNNDPSMDEPICHIDVDDLVSPPFPELCCFSSCGLVATRQIGGDVYFPMCDEHYDEHAHHRG